jgi:DNA repair photolyase
MSVLGECIWKSQIKEITKIKMKINEINAKGIITKSNLPDADFVINPYIGCQHGCIYCYADFIRRFTGHTNSRLLGYTE